MKADWKAATEEWAKEGTAWAEAVLVKTQHSSPRRPGARLAVAADGRMAGGVSMGCVENDLREHLLGILRGEGEERMVHYGVAFGESLEVGLSCGGEIDVWLRRGGNEEAEAHFFDANGYEVKREAPAFQKDGKTYYKVELGEYESCALVKKVK